MGPISSQLPEVAQTSRLRGKVAIVTAAGQGIGRAIAERLIAEGAQVHASDLDAAKLGGIPAASVSPCDVTDTEAVARWLAPHSRIDIVIHAAGLVHQGSIEETSPEQWRCCMSVSLDSAYTVFGSAIPKMKVHGGSVVAIASVASSIKGFPQRAAYGAAKGGLIGLIKACAADYVSNGIRFNAVCPGVVETPSLRQRIADLGRSGLGEQAAEASFRARQPTGRFARPDEIASLCALLASSEGEYINGQAINVDGGITI